MYYSPLLKESAFVELSVALKALFSMLSIVSLIMALIQKQIAEAMQCMKANLASLLDLFTITLENLNIINNWRNK